MSLAVLLTGQTSIVQADSSTKVEKVFKNKDKVFDKTKVFDKKDKVFDKTKVFNKKDKVFNKSKVFDGSKNRKTSKTSAKPKSALTYTISWKPVPDKSSDLAIGADGTVVSIDQQNNLWMWKQAKTTNNKWSRILGNFKRVAVDKNGTVWAIDKDNNLQRYDRNTWKPLGVKASEVSFNRKNRIAIIKPGGLAATADISKLKFTDLPGLSASSIALNSKGVVHALNKKGGLYKYVKNAWAEVIAPEAIDLAIGPFNTVMLVGKDNALHRLKKNALEGSPNEWLLLNEKFNAIAVGPDDKPWGITTGNAILASQFFDKKKKEKETKSTSNTVAKTKEKSTSKAKAKAKAKQKAAASVIETATTREKLNFELIPGAARDIAIGVDGSIFAVDFDGNIIRYNNGQKRFLGFPGTLERIAVAPDGTPWGVSSKSAVFRHDGDQWVLVRFIVAVDIAISAKGDVIVSDPAENLHRYNPSTQIFDRIRSTTGAADPRGTRVALDTQGKPWTVRTSKRIFRCDVDPCKRIGGVLAEDIAIGPDGSVIIADNNGQLRRYNKSTNKFEQLNQPRATINVVGVGPEGKPWIIDSKSNIYSSGFFPRDESKDLKLVLKTTLSASTTTTTTTNSTPTTSAFTFTKNLSFEDIKVTATGAVNDIVDFTISGNGRVIAIDVLDNIIEYTEGTHEFDQLLLASANPLQGIFLETDGTLWTINGGTGQPAQIISNSFQDISGLPGGVNAGTMVIGGNDEIFVAADDNKLYKYNAGSNSFALFTVQPNVPQLAVVGVEPNGNPWIVDDSTSYLYQFDGSTYTQLRQFTFDASSGSNGALYVTDTIEGTIAPMDPYPVYKWNASNKSFDQTNATALSIRVASDGRLWTLNDSGTNFFIRRAL